MNLWVQIMCEGAHTIGHVHCDSVVGRLYPAQEPGLSAAMATRLSAACPGPQGSGATLDLDVTTPDRFDNMYYTNQINHRGMLHSDQVGSRIPISLSLSLSHSD
jgi:peroxidase